MGLLGKRDQQRIHGAAMPDRLLARPGADMPVFERDQVFRPTDIDMACFDLFAIFGNLDLERALPRQRLGDGGDAEPLLLADRDDIGGAQLGTKAREQLLERAQRLAGHAHTDDRRHFLGLGRSALRLGLGLCFVLSHSIARYGSSRRFSRLRPRTKGSWVKYPARAGRGPCVG